MNPLKPKVARARRRMLRAYFAALVLVITCALFNAPIYIVIPAAAVTLFFGGISGLLYGLFGEDRKRKALQFTEEVHYGE